MARNADLPGTELNQLMVTILHGEIWPTCKLNPPNGYQSYKGVFWFGQTILGWDI